MAKRRKSATLKEKHQVIILIVSVTLATLVGYFVSEKMFPTGMWVAGEMKVYELVDPSCKFCYDVSIHERVLASRNVSFITERVPIYSEKGRKLIRKYNISYIPTVVISPYLFERYPEVGDFLLNFGSNESDGSYVFRNLEVIRAMGGVYKKINLDEPQLNASLYYDLGSPDSIGLVNFVAYDLLSKLDNLNLEPVTFNEQYNLSPPFVVFREPLSTEQNQTVTQVAKDVNDLPKEYMLFPNGSCSPTATKARLLEQKDQTILSLEIKKLKKPETPLLEAFVVSYCPFGLQMQRVLNEIVKRIPEMSRHIKVRYMGSIVNGEIRSMHGDREAEENLRQICVREEQPEKYWKYIGCFIREGKSESCLEEVNIDVEELKSCMEDPSRGIKYATTDFQFQSVYKVSSSPTLILNGIEVDNNLLYNLGWRSAEAVKDLICSCGFEERPDFCSVGLSEEIANTGFSSSYSSGSSSSRGGQC
ncbi:MAG: hypothetical protein J7L59_01525 [Nanoarchaeota archaeon]|nr:hypothetical protein [Nanoarchaeota archaeon]